MNATDFILNSSLQYPRIVAKGSETFAVREERTLMSNVPDGATFMVYEERPRNPGDARDTMFRLAPNNVRITADKRLTASPVIGDTILHWRVYEI